jgi:hypothetical protein
MGAVLAAIIERKRRLRVGPYSRSLATGALSRSGGWPFFLAWLAG